MQILGCQCIEVKTYITKKPLVIDSSDFSTIKKKFHYESIDSPRIFLGGLTPRPQMAEVRSFKYKDSCMGLSEGMRVCYSSLIVKLNGRLVLINTEEKFKKIFTPIENEEKALSYVAYLTHTYPIYDFGDTTGYRVFASHLPLTYSKRVSGGFEVLLHQRNIFKSNTNYFIIFRVTEKGRITVLNKVKLFEDPKEDSMVYD